MLIPEACELVLQAASIGREIFILDMGEPIKIVDLAKKMIELSGRNIEFCGLRPGEEWSKYESITVASSTYFELNQKIEELLVCEDKLKEIVPEFNHQLNFWISDIFKVLYFTVLLTVSKNKDLL